MIAKMLHVSACAATVFLLALAVKSSAQQEHDVRLSNIGGKQGRVEVYYNGQWGTVCRDNWGFFDAFVVCKQLGFLWVAANGWKHDAGNATGPAWLSDVHCNGSEARLDECMNDGWREHQCTDNAAAGVECLNKTDLEGNLRQPFTLLADGQTSTSEGHVTVLILPDRLGTSPWWLICDQGWDLTDADVLCRQRGMHSAYRATTNSYFGRPRDLEKKFLNPKKNSYLANEFACSGNESQILQCPAQDWFRDDCPPGHDAGVICNRIKEPEDFRVRLVNGLTPNEGRVEVFSNGAWGSVCIDKRIYFTYLESNVICQQLGLGYALDTPTDGRFGRSAGKVAMSGRIHCSGGEPSFAQCYQDHPDQECSSRPGSFDASVVCSGPIPETQVPVILSGARYRQDNYGYVLVHHGGRWGTICSKGWTRANSEVVCRQLGLGPPEEMYNTNYGWEGPIYLEGVSCKGDEDSLAQCQLGEWYKHTCDHTLDVRIECSLATRVSITPSFAVLLFACVVALF